VRPRSPLSKNEQGNVPQQAIRIPMPDGATSPSRKKHHTASGSVKVNFRSGSGARPVAAPVASSPAVLPAEPPAAKPPVAEPLTAKPAAGPSSSSLFSTDELFANLGWDDDGGDPEASRSISIESPADESRETAKQQSAEGLLKQGLVALEKAEYETAKETFAEVLKVEPRNRKARALYYVAGARTLMDDGNRVEAMTQLEAALAHDPSCEQAIEARQMISSGIKRSGLFRRLFTK